MGKNNKIPTYSSIFFMWCVPGLVLVLFGNLSGRIALAHFGIALLSIGVVYYGKVKQHRWMWYVVWVTLCFVYLTLGFLELLRG